MFVMSNSFTIWTMLQPDLNTFDQSLEPKPTNECHITNNYKSSFFYTNEDF
jgi:hypothetical protein